MSNSFTIGNANFGIAEAPRLEFAVDVDGENVVSLELRGSEEFLQAIQANGDWDWALHPPHFYLRAVPIPEDFRENPSRLVMEETEGFEIALYLMEHNTISNLEISALSETRIRLAGIAEIMGRSLPFAIDWRRTD